ncbi:MAG: hypothetical protein ACOYT8_00575 [Candidatus Dependentiae bacterium]
MSLLHVVSATINLSYNQEYIKKISESGLKIGFIYYNYIWNEGYEAAKLIGPDEIAERIINFDENSNIEYYGIFTRYKDTAFKFWINKTDAGLCEITFSDFINWEVEFVHSGLIPLLRLPTYGLDFARYINIMLKLCNDFAVIGIMKESIS